MTPFQLGILIGARLLLLLAAIGTLIAGFLVRGPLSVPLLAAGTLIFVVWAIVNVRSRRMLKKSRKSSGV